MPEQTLEMKNISAKVLTLLKENFPSWKPSDTRETIFLDVENGEIFSVTLWEVKAQVDLGYDI